MTGGCAESPVEWLWHNEKWEPRPLPRAVPVRMISNYGFCGTVGCVNEFWGDPDLDGMDPAALLAFIAETHRMQSRLEAMRLAAIERYAQTGDQDGAWEDAWVADQLAVETSVTIARSGRDLALAHVLTHRLPTTLAALRAGALDRPRVDMIDRAATGLPDEQARLVDARLFPRALELNPGQLARWVRRLVIEVDPESAARRAESVRQERRVAVEHEADGMSWLNVARLEDRLLVLLADDETENDDAPDRGRRRERRGRTG